MFDSKGPSRPKPESTADRAPKYTYMSCHEMQAKGEPWALGGDIWSPFGTRSHTNRSRESGEDKTRNGCIKLACSRRLCTLGSTLPHS